MPAKQNEEAYLPLQAREAVYISRQSAYCYAMINTISLVRVMVMVTVDLEY